MITEEKVWVRNRQLTSNSILSLQSYVPNLRVDANLGGEGNMRDGLIGVVFQLEG